ncbi:hypothetical protein JQC67_09950 [Aurantibacter crassamenti]|uniref:hypothetical protein n=1 Tax=Aurantibacter crassamenti TaxID=1837375 RepID=UPI0019392B23|nr:hypothetical protein [Aurantibacter crassamenti]MBM1106460.1 hypothetical protein [Aurantibacter crassamenti]
MSKDLREIFKNDHSETTDKMRSGHEKRFLERLENELPIAKKATFLLWKVAASIVILVGTTFFFINKNEANSVDTKVVEKGDPIKKDGVYSLGDLSPDLKQVENYYVSTINLEISKLELTEDNKDLIDSYLNQLEVLNVDYEKLNIELNEIGPNDQTINALIENLQLRLQLLKRLKIKLNELKSSKNEQVNIL